MFRRSIRFIVAAVLLIALGGCGGGDNNGTLGLTVTATSQGSGTGTYTVVANAQYSNATETDFQGQPISISWEFRNPAGAIVATGFTSNLEADSNGVVTDTRNITQSNEAVIITVTATTGGLSQTRVVSVPAVTFGNISS